MAKENDKEFLEYIVKELVDNPKDVKVERKVDEMGVLLSLKVNPEDMGQIIGREGSTAKAIRNLVRIVGLKNHAIVSDSEIKIRVILRRVGDGNVIFWSVMPDSNLKKGQKLYTDGIEYE